MFVKVSEKVREFNLFPFRKTAGKTIDFDTTQVMCY